MNTNEIRLIIEGEDATLAAEEMEKIFKANLGDGVCARPFKAPASDLTVKSTDPLTLAAFVLSIPGVLLTVVQLADRFKKKTQLDQSMEKVRTQVLGKREVSVKMVLPDGTVKEIRQVDTLEILNACNPKSGR